MTAAGVLAWVDGRPADPFGPQLSPLDRGFALADGLFETMRACNGMVFRLAAHLTRLHAGARALAIALPAWLDDHVADAVRAAAAAGIRDAAVRLTVSRGAGPAGVFPPPGLDPTVVVVILPPPVFPVAVHETGLAAITAHARRNEFAALRAFKTIAYAESIVALLQARAAGADEAVFRDTAGHIAEATASNLFARIDDVLVTPPTSCGALPGITRAAVIELAAARDIPVEERPLAPEDLADAREAFLTSSLRAIAPLVRLDGQPIGDGTPGSLTRELVTAYDALLDRETAA